MSKQDNFQDFITNIADALRIRYETDELINPHDFCNKILALSGLTDCNELHYLEVAYNVTDITSPTKLWTNLNIDDIDELYIDDELIENPTNEYQFTKTGKHYLDIYFSSSSSSSSIPVSAFSECHSIAGINIPTDVHSIGDYAFANCDGVKIILMSDFVTSIGQYAFHHCDSLTHLEISSGCTTIGDEALSYCTSMEYIMCNAVIPPTLESSGVFEGIKEGGKLYHPKGADYSEWIREDAHYLGHYGWTCVDMHNHDEIESVQQYVTHLCHIIRKAKRWNDETLIDPQEIDYHILSVDMEFLDGREVSPGDYCVYDKVAERIHIIHRDYYREDLFPSKYYAPIGIVAISPKHTDDETIRIVSIYSMNTNDPQNGSYDMAGIWWGADTAISGNSSYNTFCYSSNPYATSTTSKMTATTSNYLASYIVFGHIGEAYNSMTVNYGTTDNPVYYNSGVTKTVLAPLPYLEDGSVNEAYRCGALADMDGDTNTNNIINVRGTKDYSTWTPGIATTTDYPAASCCDMFFTEGTNQGDWYLPSIGELGYLIPYANEIDTSIKRLGGIGFAKDTYYLWSSTSSASNRTWLINISKGELVSMYRQYGYAGAYAFLKLDPDSVNYHGDHNMTAASLNV